MPCDEAGVDSVVKGGLLVGEARDASCCASTTGSCFSSGEGSASRANTIHDEACDVRTPPGKVSASTKLPLDGTQGSRGGWDLSHLGSELQLELWPLARMPGEAQHYKTCFPKADAILIFHDNFSSFVRRSQSIFSAARAGALHNQSISNRHFRLIHELWKRA